MREKNLDKLIGQRFNRLTIRPIPIQKRAIPTHVICDCACGTIDIVCKLTSLRSGNKKSCGCIIKDGITATHGLSKTVVYTVWKGMKARCYNKNIREYRFYGLRGIAVCDEWVNDAKAFVDWALDNGYKHGLELDRINCNGNYEPSNCRFITKTANLQNQRKIRNITYNGETKTISEWATLFGIDRKIFENRVIDLKWDIMKAATTPVIRYKKIKRYERRNSKSTKKC